MFRNGDFDGFEPLALLWVCCDASSMTDHRAPLRRSGELDEGAYERHTGSYAREAPVDVTCSRL